MEIKTQLSNALEIAGDRAKYDAAVKKILANKEVLAWILKYSATEFKTASINEIVDAIEGSPEIGTTSVYPGKTNMKPETITGLTTNDKVPNEGEITYDIRFYVYTPDRARIKLIVNIEAQKSMFPGYDLVTRGIFYGARMLSAQLDQEFSADNYDNIKKVYSIWICMDTSRKSMNTITSYRIDQHRLYGDFSGKARYDLMDVVMICLGGDKTGTQLSDDGRPKLLCLLDTLLTNKKSPEEKEQVLTDDFNIKTVGLKEVTTMCNLSYVIEEKAETRGEARGRAIGEAEGRAIGEAEGRAIGEAEGIVNVINALMSNMNIPLEKACSLAGKTVQDYKSAQALLANEK